MLCMVGYDSESRYYFRIETESRNGWCELRCFAIQDDDKPARYYDPNIHKENHYMGGLWRGRYKSYKLNNYTVIKDMFLINAFGDVNRMHLTLLPTDYVI